MAAFSCGIEALMLGSLMMLASGVVARLAEVRQVVGDLLGVGQQFGEGGDDAAGQRDVAGFDGDAGGAGEGLHDGQQRIGGQGGGFVGQRIDDLRRGRHLLVNLTERWNSGKSGCPVPATCPAAARGKAGGAPGLRRMRRGRVTGGGRYRV